MVSNRALAVTHDDGLRSDCATVLTDLGFSVTAVPDGQLALEAARLQRPHVVLLGSSPSDPPGDQLVRALRRFSDAYLLVLDDGAGEDSRARALSSGADDVLSTPLDPGQLRTRLDVLLSRPNLRIDDGVDQRMFAELVIDIAAREVLLDGKPVELTRTEFDLLCRLTDTPRRVLTREQLIEAVWGLDWYSDGHLLDVHVGNLRHKLGESGRHPRFIQTVRGVGFRFNPQPDEVAQHDGQRPRTSKSMPNHRLLH